MIIRTSPDRPMVAAPRGRILAGLFLINALVTATLPFGTLVAGMMLLLGSFSGTCGVLFFSATPCFVPWNGGRRTNLRTSTDGLRATPPDCGRNDNRFPVPPRWH